MEEVGDLDEDSAVEGEVVDAESQKWDELATKYEELESRVREQFENNNEDQRQKVPMVKPPPKPTEDEWARHQLTHTPYAAWCPHCVAARIVRHKHPRKGRAHIHTQETDGSTTGPVKISMDYMYIHERDNANV